MKLIIQIPCFNESQTLPLVFQDMPRSIPGIDEIEYQIIDDGSNDDTLAVAKQLGVHHLICIPGKNRRWLGRAFRIGIDHALARGADIVVNTDGDNQYPSSRIEDLVRPILENRAGLVIGDRRPGTVSDFSLIKRTLQILGNWTVQLLTGEPTHDAVSGFRAYSREALLKLHVITNYTYTVDSLMQAIKKGIEIEWVAISPNKKTRESRLITSLYSKVKKSGITVLRLTTVYAPFKTFLLLSAVFALPGLFLLFRFIYFYLFVPEEASGHVQSVVAGGMCLMISVQMFTLGIIGDLLAVNRTLLDDLLTRMRKVELGMSSQTVAQTVNLKVDK